MFAPTNTASMKPTRSKREGLHMSNDATLAPARANTPLGQHKRARTPTRTSTAVTAEPNAAASTEFAFDAYCRGMEAETFLHRSLHDLNSGVVYGAYTLLQIAVVALARADANTTAQTCEEASGSLHEAIEVLEMFGACEHDDRREIDGVVTLLTLAKKLIDDGIGSLQ